MADIPNIDPDFEPQARPRLNTWPMKRPNIDSPKNGFQENDIAMKLEPTIEESTSQEQIAMMSSNETISSVKQESQDGYAISSTFSDFGDSYTSSPSGNGLSDYTSTLMVSPQQPTTITACDNTNGNNSLSFTKLEALTPANAVSSFGVISLPTTSQNAVDGTRTFTLNNATNSELQCQLNSTNNNVDTATISSPVISKPKTSSRKNAWGNMSYADLITQGIESSPDKRLTLAQVYDWMVKNVPYFKDKGDSNSSAGWKNSIRHNLSLHNKFKRIQNEGAGKSSWWVINHDAKPGKQHRRRTSSLDTTNPKFKSSRKGALTKKTEYLKKKQGGGKKDSPTWARSPPSQDGQPDFDHPLNKSLASEYRHRTSSNASSLCGPMSPPRSLLTQDLEDDGPPPLSPLGGNFDLFPKNDAAFGLINELPSSSLLEDINFSNLDMLDPACPMTSATSNDRTNVYINSVQSLPPQGAFSCSSPVYGPQMGNLVTSSQQLQSLSNANRLSKQLSFGCDTPRARANTMPMPRLQPQPKYNMSENVRRQQSGETLTQDQLLFSSYGTDSQRTTAQQSPFGQYQYNRAQPQMHQPNGLSSLVNQNKTLYQLLGNPRNDDVTATVDQSQQQMGICRQQLSMTNSNEQQQSCPEVDSKYPSDLRNLDNQDIFNPGSVDLDRMLQDMEVPSSESFGMDFNSYFPQGSSSNFELVDMDNTMESSNGATMRSNRTSAVKVESQDSGYAYPTNLTQVSSFGAQPVQQQQRRFAPTSPNVYMTENRSSPQLLMGIENPSNTTMMLSPMRGNGLPPHFKHPHPSLVPQSSVGAISDYRM